MKETPIKEIKQLVEGIRFIETSLNNNIDKTDNSKFKELKNIFEKTLAVNSDMKIGDIIAFDNLEAKKPFGHGISAKEYKKVIGKKLNKNINRWDFLTQEDIDG